MVLQGWLEGQPITLTLERGTLRATFKDGAMLTLDRTGRLLTFYAEGHHFYRSLSGDVLAKWADKDIEQRRRLWRTEADLLLLRASLTAQNLRDELTLETTPELAVELNEILELAVAFDVGAGRADMNRHHRVYKSIGVLPPDQRLALVLQVTEGCPFDTCAFCTPHEAHSFRVKSPQELHDHAAVVRAYLGDLIRLCQGVFIANPNALVTPQQQLVELFDIVNQEFEAAQISTFLDGFSGLAKSADDYAALAEWGLQRVYIGLDSGHDPLLAWLHKPGQAADAVQAVRRIKAGGVNAGVIVMLGIGGQRYAEGHIHDTIEVVNQMELGGDDLLYFSESTPFGNLHTIQSDGSDLWFLSRSQIQAQREAITAGLHFDGAPPLMATYDICEFIY